MMTGAEILFDTNAVIALMEDPASIASALPAEASLVISLFSVGELQFGIRNSIHAFANQARLDRALSRFHILIPDLQTAMTYADVRTYLKRKGRPIPANDVWIAALALQNNLPLLTRDRHFGQVEGLDVRVW